MTASRKWLWGLVIAAAALIFVLANAHLIYVAEATQPKCVDHAKPDDGRSQDGRFSAAKPAC